MYIVEVGSKTIYFKQKEDVYHFLLKEYPIHFEIWSALNADYQLEQVGMYLEEPTLLPDGSLVSMSDLHTCYQKEFPHFRRTSPPEEGRSTNYLPLGRSSWYPSISYEQFVRSFPDIPYPILDLLGKRVGWKITVKQPPPGLNRS